MQLKFTELQSQLFWFDLHLENSNIWTTFGPKARSFTLDKYVWTTWLQSTTTIGILVQGVRYCEAVISFDHLRRRAAPSWLGLTRQAL